MKFLLYLGIKEETPSSCIINYTTSILYQVRKRATMCVRPDLLHSMCGETIIELVLLLCGSVGVRQKKLVVNTYVRSARVEC